MVHYSQDRLIRRKKNSRVAAALMIICLIAFGFVYMQVVETVRMIRRDNATNQPTVERVEVGSHNDSVNLYEGK